MSFDRLTLRLTGNPGAISAEAFAADTLTALGPVMRPVANAAYVPPEAASADRPLFATALASVPEAAMPNGHAIPCALPAAILCSQMGSSGPAGWFTHLLWPDQHGQAALPIAHLVLNYQPGSAMVELTLMVQGLPLADVEFARATTTTQPDWRITPCVGRSAETGDWDRWVAALDTLNASMSGLGDRLWDVETDGTFETGDAQRFIALGRRLNQKT